MISPRVPTRVVVASGKGGVGKTRVSVDLARALADRGHTVGFLDADISTPNAPEAFVGEDADFTDQPLSDGENLLPVDAGGVYLYSEGITLDDDVAILRDDEWKSTEVVNAIHTVDWPSDTEYLVVDSPPGNGSEIQTVIAEIDPNHGFLVTTGATHSARDTRRTHELFVQAGVDHSVIMNMRYATATPSVDGVEDAVQSVRGVGPAKAERITEIVADALGETTIPLFDDDVDIEVRVGAEVIADVPFSTVDAERWAALEAAIAVLPEPAVVE